MSADLAQTSTAEVVIVGMGPVGKLLAIQLGMQGHSVVVIDRNEANYPLPRAVTHCGEVARILQSVGLAPDTIPGVTEPFDGIYSWRNGENAVLLEVDWSGCGETGWYNTYFFHQPSLEDALDRVLVGLQSVTVIRGWNVVGLLQDGETATVSMESVANGDRATVTASWVIGADGANSTVRDLLGVRWRDAGYFHDWLVVDVAMGSRAASFPRVAVQLCDPQRPATLVPAGPSRRRWEFMRRADETTATLDRPDRIWELLAGFGLGPDDVEVERHAVYTFRACSAAQWRVGRVFLAGDAAHLMPPFAGQGLGAGLRDAHNLTWKLSAVLRGAADEAVLDTYATERQHHADAFIEFSTELGRIVCVTDPHEAAVRDQHMLARRRANDTLATPPRPNLGPGLHSGRHGGEVARQGRVRRRSTGRVQLLDDAIGGSGALITRRADTLDALGPAVHASLHALGIHTVALAGGRDEPDIDDIDGAYARWLDDLDADSVLVRPDFYLYGTAETPDTAALVDEFLGSLGVPPDERNPRCA